VYDGICLILQNNCVGKVGVCVVSSRSYRHRNVSPTDTAVTIKLKHRRANLNRISISRLTGIVQTTFRVCLSTATKEASRRTQHISRVRDGCGEPYVIPPTTPLNRRNSDHWTYLFHTYP